MSHLYSHNGLIRTAAEKKEHFLIESASSMGFKWSAHVLECVTRGATCEIQDLILCVCVCVNSSHLNIFVDILKYITWLCFILYIILCYIIIFMNNSIIIITTTTIIQNCLHRLTLV